MSKTLLAAGSLIIIIATGLWLHSKGRPLHQVIFSLHKIIVIITAVYFDIQFFRYIKLESIESWHTTMIVLTSSVFLIVFVSGALLSFDKLVHPVLQWIHRLSPYLLLLMSFLTFYQIRR